MKFVYLAHPFISNPTANIERINKIAKIVIESQNNFIEYVPFVPHNILSIFSEDKNKHLRPVAEEASKKMVNFCDELWICSSVISSGMTIEVNHAREKGIPIIPYGEIIKRYSISF